MGNEPAPNTVVSNSIQNYLLETCEVVLIDYFLLVILNK